MKSCIYEGFVRHRRFFPVKNEFKYRIFFMYLDLAELPIVFEPYGLWSVEKPNVAVFRRKDHLGDPNVPLDAAVRDLVEKRTKIRPQGPIRILTHLRYWGICFNPVSFYYCFDDSDRRLETIVAEVHNTPWLQEHVYVLDNGMNEHPVERWRRYRLEKRFHVSPFMDMDIDYDWRFKTPDSGINVHLINLNKGRILFDASLMLERKEISRRSLAKVLLRYPPMTAKVVAMIYWQALRLYRKGAIFYTHPDKRPKKMEELSP